MTNFVPIETNRLLFLRNRALFLIISPIYYMFWYIILEITHNKNGDFMNIENIMSKKIITVNIKEKISEVSEIIKKYNIGFIPVEQNKHIIGVITDRDIACSIHNIDENTKVETIMTNNVISIDKNKTIEEALELMKKEKIKRLLITNDEKIVGILSLSDILETNIKQEKIIETIKTIWKIQDNHTDTNPEVDQFYL